MTNRNSCLKLPLVAHLGLQPAEGRKRQESLGALGTAASRRVQNTTKKAASTTSELDSPLFAAHG